MAGLTRTFSYVQLSSGPKASRIFSYAYTRHAQFDAFSVICIGDINFTCKYWIIIKMAI